MKRFLAVLISLSVILSLAVVPVYAADEYDSTAGSWKFDFGANGADGYIGVTSDTSYTDNLSYGFLGINENDYKLTKQEHIDGFRMVKGQKIELSDGTSANNAPNDDFVTSTDERLPIRFAMNVENGGYYHVKVTLANASDSENANVTLFTERRHQLLTNAEIEPNGILEYEFNVDIETYYWKALNGKYNDDILSVDVVGKNAAIASMEVTKQENNGTTLWVVSDSTGCDQPTNFPYFNLASLAGVGQGLTKYLPQNIALSNHGDGGLASNDTNNYACVKSKFKKGDYLYIEYGHNDTDIGKYETNLQKYYDDCHNAGVKMIVVGPIDRCQSKQFDSASGEWKATLNGYSAAGKNFVETKISKGADDIAFVDINAGWIDFLNETSAKVREVRGNGDTSYPYESDSVYYYYRYKNSGIDTTHINEAGADNAAYIFFNEAKKIVDSVATPTEQPTSEPTAEPTEQPTSEPTTKPTEQPTSEPTAEPTEQPTSGPTSNPTGQPTAEPTKEPITDKKIYKVYSDTEKKAYLYAVTYDSDKTLKSLTRTEYNLTQGENQIDVTDITADKFMLWDSKMCPLNLISEDSAEISTQSDENDNIIKVQAAVLADLVNGMRNNTPYKITDDIISAGKVPNTYYPEPVYEEYDGYELVIKNAEFTDGILKNITAKVEHYSGLEKKDIPYAVAVAEILNSDGEVIGTYQSTVSTKYDTTNGNGTFNLVFDNVTTELPENGSYKIWLQGFTNDNELMEGDNYRISDYYTPESISDTYLIGDLEDIETSDTFSYFGVKNGSDLSGNNGWYLVGSSERSATIESGGYARLEKKSTSGSYVLYITFSSEVKSSKIVLSEDMYYENGYIKTVLSNKTSTPNSGYKQSITCFTISEKGKLSDSDGNELCDMPKNEWVHIEYELDMDYGTQSLTLNGETYTYDADGLKSIIPSEVTPTALEQFNINGSSKSTFAMNLKNVSVKNTVQEELPSRTVTLNDSDNGTVKITDCDKTTKTVNMNDEVEISAIPNDGYVFDGWYDSDDTIISSKETVVLRVNRDLTLTAKFTEDADDTNYLYKENFNTLTTDTLADNGWKSSSQSSVTIKNDSDDYGNYVYFNPGGSTRNLKATFLTDNVVNQKYTMEMDFGISGGNSATSEFTILSPDTTVADNTSVTGGYIFKLTSTTKSASATKSMVWKVNDDSEKTVTLTQNGTSPVWTNLKLTVDTDNSVTVTITQNDEVVYSDTLSTVDTADITPVGLNFKAGKAYSKAQFDNIKIYTE
jgi:uncharacterized repeat protein (TIGR02543 family)